MSESAGQAPPKGPLVRLIKSMSESGEDAVNGVFCPEPEQHVLDDWQNSTSPHAVLLALIKRESLLRNPPSRWMVHDDGSGWTTWEIHKAWGVSESHVDNTLADLIAWGKVTREREPQPDKRGGGRPGRGRIGIRSDTLSATKQEGEEKRIPPVQGQFSFCSPVIAPQIARFPTGYQDVLKDYEERERQWEKQAFAAGQAELRRQIAEHKFNARLALGIKIPKPGPLRNASDIVQLKVLLEFPELPTPPVQGEIPVRQDPKKGAAVQQDQTEFPRVQADSGAVRGTLNRKQTTDKKELAIASPRPDEQPKPVGVVDRREMQAQLVAIADATRDTRTNLHREHPLPYPEPQTVDNFLRLARTHRLSPAQMGKIIARHLTHNKGWHDWAVYGAVRDELRKESG